MEKMNQSSISEKFEIKYKIKLPKILKQFYDTQEYKKYEGLNTYDIPTYGNDENKKHLVTFNNESFFDKFHTIDKKMRGEDWMGMLPLCPLPKDQFLTIKDQMPEYPVYVWDGADFKLYRESFDVFLKKLLTKGEKTPIQILKYSFKKIKQLFAEEKYQEIIDLLMPITELLRVGHPTTKYTNSVIQGFNYVAVASFKLGQLDQAFAYYEKCTKCSANGQFRINMLDICYKQKNFNKSVNIALLSLKEDYLSDFQSLKIREYLGKSYIGINDSDQAKAIYQKILDYWSVADTNKVIDVRENLIQYVKEQEPNKTIAEEILTWFKPKNHEVLNHEEHKEWWDNLDSFGLFWKKYFKKAIAITNEQEPTMEDLSKMFEIEELDLGYDDLVTNLSLFKKFTKLKRFCFFGKVDSLKHLKGCDQLDYLLYNDRIIKNLQLPFDSSNLFEACEQGKVDVLVKALKSGVSAKAKDDEDHNSLLIVALKNEHLDIALLLITYGADPWAQNKFNEDAFYYCYGEDKEKMKEQILLTTKEVGLVNRETAFKIIEKNWRLSHPDFLNQKIAEFGSLNNVDFYDNKDISRGKSLISTFSKDAYYIMRKPKKNNQLTDCFIDTFHLVISEKLKDFLDAKKLKFVEYLPINILNHNREQCAIYYIINITKLHDCIDYEKSEPEYSTINPDEIREVKQLVIDESRLDEEIQIFRCKGFSSKLLWRTKFAEEFLAQGFTGVLFNDLKR